ncbi:hypothetical protein BDSB_17780 [Burkholderia dolosa PC543]|nr:hypothetical protein BDSB_17780 [Burkholderia dolosa PC543]
MRRRDWTCKISVDASPRGSALRDAHRIDALFESFENAFEND